MMEKQETRKNPFYDATKSVFKNMLDMDINQGSQSGKLKPEENVKVKIDLVGDLSGAVVYNFPKSTTLNIVKALSGMESDRLDDFATSMLGEMANIISGNAVTSLSGMDCKCDIKPPQISLSSATSDESPNCVDLLLHSQAGEMREQICLSHNP